MFWHFLRVPSRAALDAPPPSFYLLQLWLLPLSVSTLLAQQLFILNLASFSPHFPTIFSPLATQQRFSPSLFEQAFALLFPSFSFLLLPFQALELVGPSLARLFEWLAARQALLLSIERGLWLLIWFALGGLLVSFWQLLHSIYRLDFISFF